MDADDAASSQQPPLGSSVEPSPSAPPAAQPAGGYGGAPPSLRFGPAQPEPGPAPRGSLTPFITAALLVVSMTSILVLVVTGCRRYLAVAKTAEVRRELSRIATAGAVAHEPAQRVCPSATRDVPANAGAISGRKYSSQRSEWLVDAPADAGFACLHYERDGIQYFQYGYEATPTAFVARGRGDLNGDGVFSDFTWNGHVEGSTVVLAHSLTERDTEE